MPDQGEIKPGEPYPRQQFQNVADGRGRAQMQCDQRAGPQREIGGRQTGHRGDLQHQAGQDRGRNAGDRHLTPSPRHGMGLLSGSGSRACRQSPRGPRPASATPSQCTHAPTVYDQSLVAGAVGRPRRVSGGRHSDEKCQAVAGKLVLRRE